MFKATYSINFIERMICSFGLFGFDGPSQDLRFTLDLHKSIEFSWTTAGSIVRINYCDLVAQFGKRGSHKRLTRTNLKQARSEGYKAKGCFDCPRPLQIFQIVLHGTKPRQVVAAIAVVTHRPIRERRHMEAPGVARD